ncbi:MAG: hypothetical protein IPM29_29605 [Planctomycetes bacterium]|nr:hypothetical protein [Planctomycetota bacterium]
MTVAPEDDSAIVHDLSTIVDGPTAIEHSLSFASGYEGVLSLSAASRTGYLPTLVVGYGAVRRA